MDKPYWNDYYKNHRGILEPTSFAHAMAPRFPPGAKILELGCGNGRDAHYFASLSYHVLACDQSDVIINAISGQSKSPSPLFFEADIANMPALSTENIDVIYTRFVLHALSDAEAAGRLPGFSTPWYRGSVSFRKPLYAGSHFWARRKGGRSGLPHGSQAPVLRPA